MSVDPVTVAANGRTRLNLSHRRGDTWGGIQATVSDAEGTPIDLDGATVSMQVKRSKADRVALLTWGTANGTIAITDGPGGQFTVESRIVDLTGRSYVFDVQCILSDGTIRTVLHGCWSISDDVTR